MILSILFQLWCSAPPAEIRRVLIANHKKQWLWINSDDGKVEPNHFNKALGVLSGKKYFFPFSKK